ncbi:MAG: orotidine-5'-phosphate decarboxylase [Hadesarchaea archaeon]|jgi:orotidine-5'-phosphate decarboxylase|nr:MAG: orotidine-5'-phosphate decarboxylase [Hadesarchaea archaeon]
MEGLLGSFTSRLVEKARRADSRIVLAFDPTGELRSLERARDLLSQLSDRVAGIKLGLPSLLVYGGEGLRRLMEGLEGPFICDLKMADIGYVNRLVAGEIFELGFDAVIAHAFVGIREGLEEVVGLARERGRGVLAVCAMSHRGAEEYLNPRCLEMMEASRSAGVDGFILPATFPELLREARRRYPEALILSPGVGAQGPPPGSALRAGADFEIVGRALLSSPSPRERAEEMRREMGGWTGGSWQRR